MRRLNKATAALAVATIILAGCGGGGSAPAPHVPAQNSTAQSPANRTVVGTGKITLALPKIVTATRNGKTVAVRAIPHGAQRALPHGVARSPQFVDPSPNPNTAGPCGNGDNYLDIYVNGTLLTNLDNMGELSDSLCVQQTADSTQTVNVPLYSTSASQIVAIEWDTTGTYLLSIGETDYGSISAGNTVTLPTLTMSMNANYIGITDLNFYSPEIVSDNTFGGGVSSFACPGTTAQFALYLTDGLGNFVPVAGYGGTATPTATGSPDGGTTAIAQTTIPGVYNVAWDGSCDSITVTANATNPAYAIYTDAYNSYEYGTGGVYPGIDDLFDNNINGLYSAFNNQLDYQSVGPASVDVQSYGG